MKITHKAVFYPVGNGDTSQIILSGGRRILFDYCHRKNGENSDTPQIDLASRLRKELEEADRDYLDVVAFTHADADHICGSTNFFELQHAAKYQGDNRIKIKQLWMPAAMLLEQAAIDEQSDEFVILRQEGRHRLLEGKGILVFSKPPELVDWLAKKLEERGESPNARDHLFVDAGTLVPGFSIDNDGVEFFCHSPFIKHCEDGSDVVRNQASLIFNVRFNTDGEIFDFLQVGDTEWDVLEDIVNITLYHNNEDRLSWDLFNIPHHCSYLALSDTKGETETTPKPKVKELLLYGKPDAYMISSSKPIPDIKDSYNQGLPPHIQARKAYQRHLDEIGGRKFLVTMEEPNASKPEPLTFEISRDGISLIRNIVTGASAIVASRSPRVGVN